MDIAGGVGDYLMEGRRADVVGAGAGDEDAAGAEQLEGAEVQFLVAAEDGIELTPVLAKAGGSRTTISYCGPLEE